MIRLEAMGTLATLDTTRDYVVRKRVMRYPLKQQGDQTETLERFASERDAKRYLARYLKHRDGVLAGNGRTGIYTEDGDVYPTRVFIKRARMNG